MDSDGSVEAGQDGVSNVSAGRLPVNDVGELQVYHALEEEPAPTVIIRDNQSGHLHLGD